MDFFEYKASAKRNTLWLYLLFMVAILALAVAVYVAATCLLYLLPLATRYAELPQNFWDFTRFVMITIATMAVILSGSWYKVNQLKKGGGIAIAQMLGGKRLRRTKDPQEKQLRNVIEEMAIASGVPRPVIFILEQQGVNAFAAGYAYKDTVIAVTRGAIEMLKRDELQGVVAHEFSHLLHSDTLLKMKMMGLLHGISMISDLGIVMIAGRNSMQYSTYGRVMHPVLMFSGLLFFGFGLLGLLAADFIKAAMSRQREYLADASAVQFTRNPEGIGNALKVIGGYRPGSKLTLPEVQQVSHLFFGEALQVWWQSNWWATHPPLASRIKRIDPTFRGRVKEIDEASVRFQNKTLANLFFTPTPSREQLNNNVAQVMQSIGEPDINHLHHAQHLLTQIPEAIHENLYQSKTAKAMVYYLLLDEDKVIVTKQLSCIPKEDSSDALTEVVRLRRLMPKITANLRLPCLDLVTPYLMDLTVSEHKMFLNTLKKLIAVNYHVSLFEYLSYHHFLYAFDLQGGKATRQVIAIAELKKQALILLGMVCQINADKKPQLILQEAVEQLFPGYHIKTTHKSNLKDVGEALEKLNLCSFEDKKILLQAVVFCVLSDGIVSTEELETVRLIATLLGCPMPALVNSSHVVASAV